VRQRRRAGTCRARWWSAAVLGVGGLALAGCAVGPRYSRVPAPTPAEYKEMPPHWKTAQPSDQISKGKWWELYQDVSLNALEDRISVSNQTLKSAQAQFEQARALVRQTRSFYYPTITAGVGATRNHESVHRPFGNLSSSNTYTDLVLPVDASYEVDVWGRVRRTVEAARANAQASAADVESVSLSLHAELAFDYFQVHTLDAEAQLLDSTVVAYAKALELTQNRYAGGIASQVDVAQAQTQLETTRAQAIDVRVQRAQFEHAIAVLVGQPASTFSLPTEPLANIAPVIPVGLPSDLLERRPDIASSERQMAQANALIGVAKAAYYPTITLSASGGFEGSTISNWFSGPSGFILGSASAVVTVFDAGRRRAVNDQAKSFYDQTVANYRQSVLAAFQDVEDDLAALRILEEEAQTQQAAVASAEHSLTLSNNRYKGGVATYLEVILAQSTALNDERTAVEIAGRRMGASVLLIKAIGGGWTTAKLPIVENQSPQQPAGQ